MKMTITGTDWIIKTVAITDRTHRVLKSGKRIPTWLNMQRRAVK